MASNKTLTVKKTMTYAAELDCDEENTLHYRHVSVGAGELPSLPQKVKDVEATIPNLLKQSATEFATSPCMGTRAIERCQIDGKKQFWTKGKLAWSTYETVFKDVNAVAKGLISIEVVKQKRDENKCVAAILADTSAEWQMSAQACFLCGMPVTTVYTTLGHEAMLHGLTETETTVLFLDWGQYSILKDKVLANCPDLKTIVFIGKSFVPLETEGGAAPVPAFPTIEEVGQMTLGGTTMTTFDALCAAGNKMELDLSPYAPKQDDNAFIMYTSGSTGMPKGVLLTHKNFVSLVAGTLHQGTIETTPADVFVAFLPLAHILELMLEVCMLTTGAQIAYAHARTVTPTSPYVPSDKPDNCDLLEVRPTIMVAVPSVLELIKNGLSMKLAKLPGLKGKLVRAAVNKAQDLPAGEGCCASCVLSLGVGGILLKKVRAQLGLDRLRVIGSGGAPLSAQTQDYVRAVLAPVAQGYGATETTGCSTVQECLPSHGRPKDMSSGTVGAIMPACEIKLKSVEEMSYMISDNPPRGEILIGGNTVSQQGYFKMPDKSREDFPVHADGKVWFHTGDIGVMNTNGTISIIDRKKDLIKLSGGEYVSLGKVEATLKQVSGIGAVVVFARADKDHCVAIVSQPERGWASVGGKPDEANLVQEIEKKLRSLSLAKFEIPTKVKVDDLVWTAENGLVTASQKVQRNPLRNNYNEPGGLLDQMDYRLG
jgi:long-chain acyl-CoA synthetase